MKKTLLQYCSLLLSVLLLSHCDKPNPPEPPAPNPTPFDWGTYDWKHSFFCHSPVEITDSSYFHGFLDGKEVCIVSGKAGYGHGYGLATTNLGYELEIGFGHKTADSVCLLYFYAPPHQNFPSVTDYFTDFQLGDLPLMDRTKTGFGLEFNGIFNTKSNGEHNERLFTTWADNQSNSILRLVEKEIVETDSTYIFYCKFEMDIILYQDRADSTTHNLPFGHLTDGEFAFKTIIAK